ncbi:MAG: mitomycin resistance protein [Chlorobiaceae bacterium]|nr:mitomycin resistance protein [Chlorobiaceae bacterium]NTV60363.1 mitomycin resistance protein [Chlorobiaceae bacterium]
MNPLNVSRNRLNLLTDLPNIGKAMAGDLRLIGIEEPHQLAGRSAEEMYLELCRLRGKRQDPCVLDVFMSLQHFMEGGEALPWWHFTGERKRMKSRLEVRPASAGGKGK